MLLCQSLSLRFDDVLGLEILDQTKLPQKEEWIHVTSPQVMLEAIQSLRVRGAPLIGIAASLFWAYWIHKCDCHEADRVYQELRRARPTAINLMNNLDYCYHVFSKNHSPTEVLRVAVDLFFNDVEQCEQMANWGASLMENGDFVLTYCNTGSLATAGIGTALGVIKRSWSLGKRIHVYVCETRPLGQGARLTLWELRKVGIPCTLISDNMVGLLMQKSKINKVIVGADRVTRKGDVANKIGTYTLAVLAAYHKIPFYVVAPSTTLDQRLENGWQIPIEERSAEEVTQIWNLKFEMSEIHRDSPPMVVNPAFDVTPYSLITKIITEKGFFVPS